MKEKKAKDADAGSEGGKKNIAVVPRHRLLEMGRVVAETVRGLREHRSGKKPH